MEGNIECGGQKNHCYFHKSDLQKCQEYSPTVAFSCGDEHKKYYGVTGYETDGHWCKLGNEKINFSDKYEILKFNEYVFARYIKIKIKDFEISNIKGEYFSYLTN